MTPAELKAVILAQPADGPVRVAYAAGNDTEVARLLRETTAAKTALRPMASSAELMGLLSPEHFAAVFDHPRFADFKATFDSGSRAGVLQWAGAFKARGLISQAELDAVTAYLTAPVEQQLPLAPGCTPDAVGDARKVP